MTNPKLLICLHDTSPDRKLSKKWAVKQVIFNGGYATFADTRKGASLQPYKFGGKELDAMYRLNIYDFHARTQTPDLDRFTLPDPLAEKTPHLSPYLFCANDPVNNIDPTGMEVWFNDFMYTPGCEYFGDAKIYLYQALDRNGFIFAVAHESMHAGQFLNGQGGQSIFNEVEAYAFEAAITSNHTVENFPNDKIVSMATSGLEQYRNSMSTLQWTYDFIDAMFLFKRESGGNIGGLYDNYTLMPNNRNLYHSNKNSILLKYSPWRK